MALHTGDRIGPYEIVGPIGSGAMGEVYRARDRRLNRDVALKVLPDQYRLDERRAARLRREAQILASLNHPNIATLFGIEEGQDQQALVMELVEGETLADRIAMAGTTWPISIPDATGFARQIADALEAAHERGIIHRDLKPANVKIRPDGTVKVLDFGLAGDGGTEADTEPGSPTATRSARGSFGAGTPAYMSPEQARGGVVDQRSDVWSFGCVLYEMLTGRRAFDGSTASDAIAAVTGRDVDFTVLPSGTPPALHRLLRRALTKDQRHRLHNIADARLEIEEARDGSVSHAPEAAPARARFVVAAAALSALIGAIVAGLWFGFGEDAVSPARVVRFELVPPAATPLRDGGDTTRLFALSPDGTRIAYMTQKGLAIRSLDRVDPEVLDARAFGGMPFFSPDGQWIGGTGDGISKISAAGGPVIRLADVGPGASGAWGEFGIVFADIRGLFRVPAEGGTPERLPIGKLGDAEQVSFPEPLPGRRVVLFTVVSTRSNTLGGSFSASTSRIEALDLDTGIRTIVVRGGGRPRYVRGHLLYVSGTTLLAAPFDIRRLQTTGEARAIPGASSEFAASDDGTLVYALGLSRDQRNLVWVDRSGREAPLGTPAAQYVYPRVSPDGRRIALDVTGPNRDIWIWDTTRRVLERFTTDPTENMLPTWSPDGRQLAFASGVTGVPNMFIQPIDGSRPAAPLRNSPFLNQPLSFAADGRLIFTESVPGRGRDIKALRLDTQAVEGLIETDAEDVSPEVSPDGRWLAYMSDESGQFEIYVRPYPFVGGGRWKVSLNGGRSPLWSRDGRELFYRDFEGALITVPVASTRTFVPGTPSTVFPASRTYLGFGSAIGARNYDVSLDGRRFLMIKVLDDTRPPSFMVVQNWEAEVESGQRR
jgi:eukaryotic-like serine/threonine-protein kinase